MHERITGPFHGYHIAVYACPMGDMGAEYLGHYKICRSRPRSYSDCDYVHHGSSEPLFADPHTALGAAETTAMQTLAKLPPAPPKVRHWGTGFATS